MSFVKAFEPGGDINTAPYLDGRREGALERKSQYISTCSLWPFSGQDYLSNLGSGGAVFTRSVNDISSKPKRVGGRDRTVRLGTGEKNVFHQQPAKLPNSLDP